MGFVEGVLPIFIVGIVFTVIAVIGVAIIIASIKKRKMEIDAYKAAIEKGLPVPELKIVKSPISTLKAALVWIAVGLGFSIMLFFVGIHDRDYTGIGLSAIPILVGVALFISYIVEKKEKEKEKNESS